MPAEGALPDERDLALDIEQSTVEDPAETDLRTDERVLARITDGIYRQPASALRELIANAYDADADEVVIATDPPRFRNIVVKDNGSGMSPAALAHVIEHIGGSLKRTIQGQTLDIVSSENASRTPGGRNVIGRIGIGLFSVSQLTSHFQIITKRAGDDSRYVADIVLATERYEKSLQEPVEEQEGDDGSRSLKAGTVKIWKVEASDRESHGTEIVLMDLRPQTKDILRSRARWETLEPANKDDLPSTRDAKPPIFHTGRMEPGNPDGAILSKEPSLPWATEDAPEVRFQKLVCEVRERMVKESSFDLDRVLDEYLQMIWKLALALPAPYVGGHPFDLRGDMGIDFYLAKNKPGTKNKPGSGQAGRVTLNNDQTLRAETDLSAPEGFEDVDFKVFVDGLRLMRPIRFDRVRESPNALQNDLMLVGKYDNDFSSMPEHSGDRLSFEAYLHWTPVVAPKEHNGVLVRLKGASGTLFDTTFMGYQVAEQQRRRQITAEIFVHEGLEYALNIDRESFNYSNFHYQIVSRWLHGALRQLINRQKADWREARKQRKEEEDERTGSYLSRVVDDAWASARGDDSDRPSKVVFEADPDALERKKCEGTLPFLRGHIFGEEFSKKKPSDRSEAERHMEAVVSVLEAYNVLNDMDYTDQLGLILQLRRILLPDSEMRDASGV